MDATSSSRSAVGSNEVAPMDVGTWSRTSSRTSSGRNVSDEVHVKGSRQRLRLPVFPADSTINITPPIMKMPAPGVPVVVPTPEGGGIAYRRHV
jgi:hypothetical protein